MAANSVSYEQARGRVQKMTLADGRQMAFRDIGPEKGYPVVFLHGTPGSCVGLLPNWIELSRRRTRLIVPDRPGFGESDRHEGRSIASIVSDVRQLTERLEIERFSAIGKSGGAPHALACAALLPERVQSVAALVPLAPRNADDLDWYAGMGEGNTSVYKSMELYLSLKNEPNPEKKVDRLFLITEQEQTLSRQLQMLRSTVTAIEEQEFISDELWSEVPDSDRRVIGNLVIRTLLQETFDGATRGESVRDGYLTGQFDDHVAFVSPWGFDPSTIECPTLLSHGEQDIYSPVSHTRWLARRINDVVMDINADAGHFGAVKELPHALSWLSWAAATRIPEATVAAS